MSNNVWKLVFIAGTAARIEKHVDGQLLTRKAALDKAVAISKKGWRVWVEHYKTGKRLFENDAERHFRLAQ